jgi:hypothetical protein
MMATPDQTPARYHLVTRQPPELFG